MLCHSLASSVVSSSIFLKLCRHCILKQKNNQNSDRDPDPDCDQNFDRYRSFDWPEFHLANQMRFQRGPDSSVSIGQKTTNRTRWKVISLFTAGRTFDWPEF
jgi:hypothetical protein